MEETKLTDFSAFHETEQELRRKRYSTAADLLDSWLSEKTNYDDQVSKKLKKSLKDRIKFGTPTPLP